MTARSIHGAKVRLVLGDGAWHTLDELVATCGHLVPEGAALRTAERTRHQGPSTPAERTRGDREVALASGRRTVIRHMLISMVRRGTAERSDAGYRMVDH